MYSCDECDRGYASLSARSQHKKKKHTKTDPVNVKEKPAEDQVIPVIPGGELRLLIEDKISQRMLLFC